MTPSGPTHAEGGPLHHDIGLSLIALSALAVALWHGAHLQRPEISGPFLLDGALGLAWHTGWVLLMLAVIVSLVLHSRRAYNLLLGWMALAVANAWWEFAGFLFNNHTALPLHEQLVGHPLDLGTFSGLLMMKTAGITLAATLVTLYAWRRRSWFGIASPPEPVRPRRTTSGS
ncbi:MAG: hypothetical protein KC488_03485 [Candidatus Cloacimonetes bacterium]|nr:hypothetical protein [Candidatus Cloacimonadota bacterium]